MAGLQTLVRHCLSSYPPLIVVCVSRVECRGSVDLLYGISLTQDARFEGGERIYEVLYQTSTELLASFILDGKQLTLFESGSGSKSKSEQFDPDPDPDSDGDPDPDPDPDGDGDGDPDPEV